MLACPTGLLETISRCFHAQSRLLFQNYNAHGVVLSRHRTVLLRDGSLVTEQRHVVSLAKTLYNFLDARGQLSLCGGFVCVPNRKRTAIYNFQLQRGKWCSVRELVCFFSYINASNIDIHRLKFGWNWSICWWIYFRQNKFQWIFKMEFIFIF